MPHPNPLTPQAKENIEGILKNHAFDQAQAMESTTTKKEETPEGTCDLCQGNESVIMYGVPFPCPHTLGRVI